MAVNLSPVFNEATYLGANPLVGGKLFTYVTGSTTKQPAFTTSAGDIPHTNPIILNSRGEPPEPLWLTDGQAYKFVLAPPTDTDPPTSPIRTIDNITGVNDIAAGGVSEWQPQTMTPTFISPLGFSLPGDQTSAFHPGRRIKATVAAGTVYGTITSSVFTTLTTVTLALDSGALDSGLSAVAVGIISADNTSAPLDDKAILSPYSPLAVFENLLVSLPLFTTVVVNATKFVVTNSNGRKQVVPVTSVTINITASGVNGLDTGVEAANSWYYYYVIWNGATVAGLFSLSATSPVMPAGYTHKGLAGAARNDGNSNFVIFEQRGAYVDLMEVTVLAAGSATAVTPFSLAAALPPNVFKALLETHYVPLAGGVNMLASIWSESTGTIAVTRTGNVSVMDTGQAMRASSLALLRISQTLFYTVQTNSYLDVAVIGYIW